MSCNCCDCQDEHSEEEKANFPPTWEDAEPANEGQAKAWAYIINNIYDENTAHAINLPAAVAIVCQRVKVRPENYASLSLQIERFIRESPLYEIRKGKNGGVFRSEPDTRGMKATDALDFVDAKRAAVKPNAIMALKNMITEVEAEVAAKFQDNYTCGCGNTKCNTTEKSCWKCGAAIKP